jgi:hypothetical protein
MACFPSTSKTEARNSDYDDVEARTITVRHSKMAWHRGSIYRGARDIEATGRTKIKSPQTNGFVERHIALGTERS